MSRDATINIASMSTIGLALIGAQWGHDAELHVAAAEVLRSLSGNVRGELERRAHDPDGPSKELSISTDGISAELATLLAKYFLDQVKRMAAAAIPPDGGETAADEAQRSLSREFAFACWAIIQVCQEIAGGDVTGGARA